VKVTKLYLGGLFVMSNFYSERACLTGNNSAKSSRFENRTAYEVVSWLQQSRHTHPRTESKSFSCTWLMKTLHCISNKYFWHMMADIYSVVNKVVQSESLLQTPTLLWAYQKTRQHTTRF